MWDTLIGHSCGTLLWHTLVGHSCGTLLWVTLVVSCVTLCGTLLWDTLVGQVVLQGRQFSASSSTGQIALSPAFRALNTHDLRRGLRARGTNRTLACISRTRHARSPQRVARAWDKSHSRLHFAHSTRTISAEGCARMGQIALSPAFGALDAHDLRRGLRVKSPKRAFRTRLPQKLTRQSLQNERFVRDFLQKSSGNTHRSTHTHHAALPSSFAIPAPPNNIRSHANPNGTATFTSTTTHNLTIPCACHESFPIHTSNAHKVLRLPRNVTSPTPRNLTIPCACHENCTSTLQSPHEVLRLPRKVTISSHVSFNKICITPHVWNDFDPFRAHSHPSKSPFQLRLVTKTELRCHTLKRKSQWHGHIQHPKNTTLQTLIPMELRRNLRISQNAAPVQRSASRFLRDMSVSRKSQWNSGAN